MKLKSLLPLALAGSLAFGGSQAMGKDTPQTNKPTVTSKSQSVSRGIRNNNPGNIRKSTIKWKGAIGDDGSFIKFALPEDGIRAMARILKVYTSKYKINTVAGAITRWAPPKENRTDAYIAFVAKKMGKKSNEVIDFTDSKELAKMVSAIIEFENGTNPYDSETINRGIAKS
jgi:hypothetical protein